MQLRSIIGEKAQYRLVLCGHKAVEAGAVCMVLMVQGHLMKLGLSHLALASETGLLAIFPALGLTFTRYARHLANRWTIAVFLGACTILADSLVHKSHYEGAYTEAVFTGIGAFVFSIALSYTPIGKRIDRLAETFLFVPKTTAPLPEADVPEADAEAGDA